MVTYTRASGDLFGSLPGPRAEAEYQPAEAKPEPGHKTVTDPSAVTTRGQCTNTAGVRLLGIISPKPQSSGLAADGQPSCAELGNIWQNTRLIHQPESEKLGKIRRCHHGTLVLTSLLSMAVNR